MRFTSCPSQQAAKNDGAARSTYVQQTICNVQKPGITFLDIVARCRVMQAQKYLIRPGASQHELAHGRRWVAQCQLHFAPARQRTSQQWRHTGKGAAQLNVDLAEL